MWTELITSGVDTNNKTIAVFTMTEDTFFNSKVYKKIIYNQANYYYVHEDTQNKKIYVYDSFFSKDTLWYDFSLQTGDTLNVGCTSLILVNKSIEYFAGSNRNKLEFSWDIGNPVVLTWYEGIGDIYGVFWPLCFTGSGYRLLCYFENDTLLYHNLGLNDSCFILLL
jgi:nitrous oxide reductase